VQLDVRVATAAPARTVHRALLHRRAAVHLPAGPARVDEVSTPAMASLEAAVLDRGYLLAPELRAGFAALDDPTLLAAASTLLSDLDELLGSGRRHTPLFRDFPHGVPADTLGFWVDRVLALLAQEPAQPCVLCGTEGSVHAVNPCAHLICRRCFDGSNFSGCPVCHRALAADDPFLQPAKPRRFGRRTEPQRLRVLRLGGSGDAALRRDALTELTTLLARPGSLSPGDTDDLLLLLDVLDRSDLSWLPAELPSRTTKAHVLAWLLADRTLWPSSLPVVQARLGTATDVLRLLVVRSGGAATLIDRPRLATVPRPLRRAVLAALDALPLADAVQEMRGSRRAWLAVGEQLHVGEHAGRYPTAAAMFAALRGTDVARHPLSREAALGTQAEVVHGRLVVTTYAAQVELALHEGRQLDALTLLTRRPGELLRRLDHLLRTSIPSEQEQVLAALPAAAAQVAPAVLLSALGQVRTRHERAHQRLVFPASGAAAAHVLPDLRLLLTPSVAHRAARMLQDEVLRRAALLPQVDLAVLDEAVGGLTVPFGERTAARALVTLPRGSELELPAGRHLRLFCHWVQPADQRVDLDLSLALFDEQWAHVDTCDYTHLRTSGATHSGDFTNAPAPGGASEFLDLDLDALDPQVRYLLATVYSYNSVPFDQMNEAYAGLMLRAEDPEAGPVFDPSAVEQRFDLASPAKTSLPLLVDVQRRTMRWLDVSARVTGTNHAVWQHAGKTGLVARALDESIRRGERVMLGELARWHAAARARTIIVRSTDGSLVRYDRSDETAADFAARLANPATGSTTASAGEVGAASFAVLLRGDIPVVHGAEVFALHPLELNASTIRLLAASDLVAALAV
jgi:stress response protein SCP2